MLDFKISLVFALLTFGLLTGGMEFKSENLAYGSSKIDDAMDKLKRESEKAQDKMEENTEETKDKISGIFGDAEKTIDEITENTEKAMDKTSGFLGDDNNKTENEDLLSQPFADCISRYSQNVSITLKTDDDCEESEFEDAVDYFKLDEFPIEKTDRELGNAKMIELVR